MNFLPFWWILANFRENSWVVGDCAVSVPADASTVAGKSKLSLASLLLRVPLLLFSLWCSYCLCYFCPPSMLLPAWRLHCFARIPAFDSVHTVLAVLLLVLFLLLLVFQLFWAVMKLLSSLMLLVAGALPLLLVSLLLLASRLWQAFLLLLAFFKFLMVSCCWSLCYFLLLVSLLLVTFLV